tara:strand:- start:115 stop:303 length:189 start_codon:yes stop_codon:yes gene_type:complete
MSYEAGSTECKNLIEAKENLIQVMASLSKIKNIDHLNSRLTEIYQELEAMHDMRRQVENDLN